MCGGIHYGELVVSVRVYCNRSALCGIHIHRTCTFLLSKNFLKLSSSTSYERLPRNRV